MPILKRKKPILEDIIRYKKLEERSELSKKLLPSSEVEKIRDESLKENNNGVYFGVGVQLNDKVKGNLIQKMKQIPSFKNLKVPDTPKNEELGTGQFILDFPIRN